MNPNYKPLTYSQIPSNFSNFSLKLNSNQNYNNNPVYFSSARLEHINCIVQPTKQLGGIYLGDIVCLLKPQLLESNKIRSVLTCMIQPISKPNFTSIQNHKIVLVKDSLQYPIMNHFQQTYEFIAKMRKQNKNVLIHCHAGVSRSATILCAYLIKQNCWDPTFALNFVRIKRERAKPNYNFFKQLQYFYNEVILPSKSNLVKNTKNSQILRKKLIPSKQQEKITIHQQQLKRDQKNNNLQKQIITLEQQIEYHSQLIDIQEKQKKLSKNGGKIKIPFQKYALHRKSQNIFTNRSQILKSGQSAQSKEKKAQLVSMNKIANSQKQKSYQKIIFQKFYQKNKFQQYYKLEDVNENRRFTQNSKLNPYYSNQKDNYLYWQTPQKQKNQNQIRKQIRTEQTKNRWSQQIPGYQYRFN